MLFRLLARTLRRAWAPMLLTWVFLLVGTWWAAPRFRDVAEDKEFAFLPEGAPSRRADEVYRQAFPDDRSSSNIVLVVHRAHGGPASREQALKFISDVLEPSLWQLAQDE